MFTIIDLWAKLSSYGVLHDFISKAKRCTLYWFWLTLRFENFFILNTDEHVEITSVLRGDPSVCIRFPGSSSSTGLWNHSHISTTPFPRSRSFIYFTDSGFEQTLESSGKGSILYEVFYESNRFHGFRSVTGFSIFKSTSRCRSVSNGFDGAESFRSGTQPYKPTFKTPFTRATGTTSAGDTPYRDLYAQVYYIVYIPDVRPSVRRTCVIYI